jgi:hypothetical protein
LLFNVFSIGAVFFVNVYYLEIWSYRL